MWCSTCRLGFLREVRHQTDNQSQQVLNEGQQAPPQRGKYTSGSVWTSALRPMPPSTWGQLRHSSRYACTASTSSPRCP